MNYDKILTEEELKLLLSKEPVQDINADHEPEQDSERELLKEHSIDAMDKEQSTAEPVNFIPRSQRIRKKKESLLDRLFSRDTKSKRT